MKIYCSKVNESLLNQTVVLNGWIKKVRKLGSLVFADLKDRFATVQIFASSNDDVFEKLTSLTREDVVQVTGIVQLRKQENKEMLTGKFEVYVKDIKIYSKAETPPLIIENETDANEEIRFKYRYLDLRRDVNIKAFELRSKVTKAFRDYLHDQDFIEVETPILGKATPEGARDYYVPTRSKKFYALPQSPQTFKQLLMVSGFQKYFQIAKCFRDEDLRSDRQPEFTQVDMELSFVNELDIQTHIENLLKYVFKKVRNIDIKTPFLRMSYKDAMHDYGVDKPDLRYEMKIQDGNEYFKDSSANIFKTALTNNKTIRFLVAKNSVLTKKQVNDLEKFAKDKKAKGLAWIAFDENNNVSGSLASIKEDYHIYKQILNDNNAKYGTILLIADEYNVATQSLGIVRINLASMLNLKKDDHFEFLWVVNWPLFEYNEEEDRYVAAHHPFTAPAIENEHDFDTNQANAMGRSYDVVLNGYELGGGSIRIIDPNIQKRMFKAIHLTDEEVNEKFGFIINAFKYGVPPHGGIALGLDRLMMILINSEYIRDVVAFPKNNNGVDMMLDSPTSLNNNDLQELGIIMNEKSK